MVSNDAEMLITDFGFASVGYFGPPPPSTQKPGSVPSIANAAGAAANVSIDGVPELTVVDVAEKHTSDDVAADYNSSGGMGSTNPPRLITSGGEENEGPQTVVSNARSSPRNGCADDDGGMVMPAMSTSQAKPAAGSFVPTAEAAHAQRSRPAGGAQVAPASPTTQAQLATAAISTGSPLIGVGKGRRDNNGARKETGARTEAQGSRRTIADDGKQPNLDSVLHGTIQGFTLRYQSPEVSQIMEKKCKAAAAAMATAQAGDRPSQTQTPQVSALQCILGSAVRRTEI